MRPVETYDHCIAFRPSDARELHRPLRIGHNRHANIMANRPIERSQNDRLPEFEWTRPQEQKEHKINWIHIESLHS